MTTTNNLKKILHRPSWELVNPLPSASAAGSFCRSLVLPTYNINQAYFCANTTSLVYAWDSRSDTEILLAASGIAGTFGAGSCGVIHPSGPTFTASAGSTTTATSTLTIPMDLRGYRIRVTSGPGAGDERVIKSNTLGANSVITVSSPFSATITSSSVFLLLTGRFWVFNPAATPGLGYFDYALAAWTSGKAVAGVTFTGTTGFLESTASIRGNLTDAADIGVWNNNAAGTVGTPTAVFSASTTTLLTLSSGRNWTPSQWVGAVCTIVAGTNAGYTGIVTANTNLTFTVSPAMSGNMDASSVWQLTQPFASSGSNSAVFVSHTGTVLTVSGTAWTSSQWISCQLRAISGTGAGQIKTITANTGTTITTAAFGTAFDSTTIWVIEGNDDALYLAGNAAVAMFKYSISGNTWATATAGAARAGAPGAGMGLCWIYGSTDAAWTNQNAIKNGRYLYSHRGAGGAVLDQYDLAGLTWISGVAYGNNGGELFTTGTSHTYDGMNTIYIAQGATGRFFGFDVVRNLMYHAGEHQFIQSTAVEGHKLIVIPYYDGSTVIVFLYHWINTGVALLRAMMWYNY